MCKWGHITLWKHIKTETKRGDNNNYNCLSVPIHEKDDGEFEKRSLWKNFAKMIIWIFIFSIFLLTVHAQNDYNDREFFGVMPSPLTCSRSGPSNLIPIDSADCGCAVEGSGMCLFDALESSFHCGVSDIINDRRNECTPPALYWEFHWSMNSRKTAFLSD